MNDDRLHQILRQGDPAAQDAALSADEARAMRRTVLTAVPEPRRRRGWLPALATAAAAMLVLALAVTHGPWHWTPAAPPAAPVRVAAVPTPPVAPVVPSVTVIPVTPSQVPVKSSRPARRHPPVRAARVLPAPPAAAPVLVASLPVREIRFSTPGGTRVIWELAAKDSR
ncbi:MAG TPA: hypothetical protein VIA62_22095 [Thermoanaerobaculia bacterium]|jgi:hypothetical protein|nr:hypothetical protein [Thermoanaerobaculia bacterium]